MDVPLPFISPFLLVIWNFNNSYYYKVADIFVWYYLRIVICLDVCLKLISPACFHPDFILA